MHSAGDRQLSLIIGCIYCTIANKDDKARAQLLAEKKNQILNIENHT